MARKNRSNGVDVVQVAEFPKREQLYGSIIDGVTPLDRFFWLGGLGHVVKDGLSIDPKLVYLNPIDAKVLYEVHRDFVVLHMGDHAQEVAADQWLAYGPTVHEDVPIGVVAMERGYVSIV